MKQFNERNQPRLMDYKIGDFHRVDKYSGSYFSYTKEGNAKPIPNQRMVGSNNAGKNLTVQSWELLFNYFLGRKR